MTSWNQIIDVIKKLNSYCSEIDALETSIRNQYQAENTDVQKTTARLIDTMRKNFEVFKNKYFSSIKNEINDLVNLLCKDSDYRSLYHSLKNSTDDFLSSSKQGYPLEFLITKFKEELRNLNKHIHYLNVVNFNQMVPPVKTEIIGEAFITYTKDDKSDSQHFDHEAKSLSSIKDPKPIKEKVKEIFSCCIRINMYIDAISLSYEENFNIPAFNSFVNNSAVSWLNEFKAKLKSKYDKRFDELFRDEKVAAIPKSFFTKIEEEGKTSDVDFTVGPTAYKESINIGNVSLFVDDKTKHLQYMSDSPTLNRYLKNGYLSAPLILDLKKCGNILLNINEDTYSDSTINFVNQLIMQFLVSFPANRITFCLIDIDNKMGFSQFKIMTKINTGILFNGIIRDDRQLENTIKDMEQTMYKVEDDILSYNSVDSIYEYNTKFEANPQNVHLFVLVNYPVGMRGDIAKRVTKIVQNGNRAGIFSIIINNKACPLTSSYKAEEHNLFIENVTKAATIINKNGEQFTLNLEVKNSFTPKPQSEVSVSSLAKVVEMLKDSAENNRQKVIPLSRMFDDTNQAKASAKGIAPAEAILDIPIGLRGGEIQNLLLKTTGDGSAHAVIIGGTGSGKSNLLHTIIMSACYKYSPEDLNLYLVDFKGGVEFKFYEANKNRAKQMPHIKLTGLTSDLEDGVAILNNLHKELRRREDEFRLNHVEDIVQYKAIGNKMPRLFVIIDEIQELFEQDDRLGQKAIDILRELFKKGRAFGINILWASQNIPKVPGLKDKILSQIGNRISLRLNEPDDAIDIKIDPKVVKNLNRPEKGLGVINDIRYGNDSIEFRVAFAETSENRQKYSQEIIDKWKFVTNRTKQEPLFIVGDDDNPIPTDGNTLYTHIPRKEDIISKSFDSYVIQLGQDYVTGKPFDMSIALRENKMNVLLAGYDIEILRDMMGYATLSVITNQMTNLDCVNAGTKIYYANGEMINPKNSNDLFNVIRTDFSHIIEPVSTTEQLLNCIKTVYVEYKQRSIDSDNSEYAIAYPPCFVVIHSLQRYIDLFNENPLMQLATEQDNAVSQEPTETLPSESPLDEALNLFASAQPTTSAPASPQRNSKMPDNVFFSDAFKELLTRGGKFGVHFILSVDNPLAISALKNDVQEIMYKVFVKGINTNVLSQILGDYKASNSLNNPKVALVSIQDERTKIRVYRYDDAQDSTWYKDLYENYHKLLG